jgi:hypothetical protein
MIRQKMPVSVAERMRLQNLNVKGVSINHEYGRTGILS